ncbi:PorT family protein [Treponema sp. TIM-1]|uniref:porin family protein n=1 Tax=Treponema sp. TIM-1 TaxID=2898417 RepID=UPI003980EAFE
MKIRCFPHQGISARGMIFYGIIGLMLLPVLVFAQTGPTENTGRPETVEKLPVAVLPLIGEEKDMVQPFYQGIIESVAALGKYTPQPVPQEVVDAVEEIPTDLPPHQEVVAGARYALTGGVYPGNAAGEYYLQLWLWDMAGATMIYTDDLIYEDINDAMLSLPGLVEWLFSHIMELTIEPPAPELRPDPGFTLGFRFGISPRWYISPGEQSAGAQAVVVEGGVSGSFRLNPLLALQLELIMTGDTVVYRGLNLNDQIYNVKYSSLSLMVPLLLRMNFRPGLVRLSPLAGLYFVVPLGDTRYRESRDGSVRSYSTSFSVPLGFTLGFEAAIKFGPGEVFSDLRYNGDFGTVSINDPDKTKYKRHIFSITLGYEFGFFYRNRGSPKTSGWGESQ